MKPSIAASDGAAAAQVEDIQLFLRNNFADASSGMVIARVDERGARILAAGKLDNSNAAVVNGDTIFEIGSITKVFTALLLLDIAKRG